MPNRILRASLRQSRRWNNCSLFVQSLYIRLLTLVDDFGRYEAHPQLLANECFPYGDEKGVPITREAIAEGLQCICNADLAQVYSFGGNDYLQLSRWKEHVRTQSKFPDPLKCKCTANAQQMITSPPSPSPTPTPTPSGGAGGEVQVEQSFYGTESPEPNGKPVGCSIRPFEEFFELYPKKVQRDDAEHAWVEVGAINMIPMIMKALRRHICSPTWKKMNGKYVPLPARWIRERYWERKDILDDDPCKYPHQKTQNPW